MPSFNFQLSAFSFLPPSPAFQKTTASLHWSSDALHFHIHLEDTHIFSQSTAHNQSLHLLGDTLEIFLMLPGATEYVELHVSPHNHRTFLRWPLGAIEKVRAGEIPLEGFRQNPDAFTSQVHLLENAWEVHLQIPPAVLNIDHFITGQKMLVSLCRYDYENLKTPPILSTSSPHKIKNFHHFEDWPQIELTLSLQPEGEDFKNR